MTDTQTPGEQHAAPREAWDAIAASYDTYVAPKEVPLAKLALELAGLSAGASRRRGVAKPIRARA